MKYNSDQAVAEFLARGGQVQVVPIGKSGYLPGESMSMWGRKKAVPAAVPVMPLEVYEDEDGIAIELAVDEDDIAIELAVDEDQ